MKKLALAALLLTPLLSTAEKNEKASKENSGQKEIRVTPYSTWPWIICPKRCPW